MTEAEEPYFIITSKETGQRLDRIVKEKWLPQLSRQRIRFLIDGQYILLNNRPTRKGIIPSEGDRLDLQMSEDQLVPAISPDSTVTLDVLYEDAYLVALNKASGISSHPLQVAEQGTVANGLIHRYPEMLGIGFSSKEPGLVHRLDRQTSGILLAARKAFVFERLRVQFEQGQVLKGYQALVYGRLKEKSGVIDNPIGNKARRAKQVMVMASSKSTAPGIRNITPAETQYRVARTFRSYSLVRLWMTTGVRHQLRAHLAYFGHPVVGDWLYGKDFSERIPGKKPLRHLLHASEIRFFHPANGRSLRLRSPLPKDFQDFLDRLP